jgi:antitoxin MazE
VKFAKWGNSLAIRIPAEVVAKLGISPDEEAQIKVTGEHSFEITRDRRRHEAIEAIRKLARPLPPGNKFIREELYDRFDRSLLGRQLADLESSSKSSLESGPVPNQESNPEKKAS